MKLKVDSKIGILVKKDSPEGVDLADKITSWFSTKNIDSWVLEASPKVLTSQPLDDTQLVFVLGGDGTIVSIARQSLGFETPLVGVNFGRIGFLAELTKKNCLQACAKIYDEGFKLDKRMSLSMYLERKGQKIYKGEAINDISVTRGECARLASLHLYLNDESLMDLRSDGLIVSTPTGSSGYSCSAGGSLLSPNLNVYSVTAICPFLNAFFPLVFEDSTTLKIEVSDANTSLYLTLDGQENYPLEVGDTLWIKGRKERFFFADLGMESYVERLKRVGFTRD